MQGGPALTHEVSRLLPLRLPSLHYEVGPRLEGLGTVDSEEAGGVLLDTGQPRYVSRDHVQIERMPGQPR